MKILESGGGVGGSFFINVSIIEGIGVFDVYGGDGGILLGGGGSGGIVVFYYKLLLFFFLYILYGGSGKKIGVFGLLYLMKI